MKQMCKKTCWQTQASEKWQAEWLVKNNGLRLGQSKLSSWNKSSVAKNEKFFSLFNCLLNVD